MFWKKKVKKNVRCSARRIVMPRPNTISIHTDLSIDTCIADTVVIVECPITSSKRCDIIRCGIAFHVEESLKIGWNSRVDRTGKHFLEDLLLSYGKELTLFGVTLSEIFHHSSDQNEIIVKRCSLGEMYLCANAS